MLLVALAAACAAERPRRPPPSPPAPPPAPAPASEPPAPRDPFAFAVPAVDTLSVVELAQQTGETWERRDLPKPQRIALGAVVGPGIESPKRVVINAQKKASIVDVASGQSLVALPAPAEYVAPGAGVVTLAGTPPRLVRLADLTLVTPTLDANGEKLSSAWLAASEAYDVPIAVGLGESGAFAGVPSADLTRFELQKLPLGEGARGVAAVRNAHGAWQLTVRGRSGAPFPFAREPAGACTKLRMVADGTLSCLEIAAETLGVSGARWMQDGWFSGESYLSHVSWQGKRIELEKLASEPKARCSARATRDAPPRVVIACHGSDRAFLWLPNRLLGFEGPPDPNDLGGLVAADSGEVLPISARSQGEERVERWLDLVAPRVALGPKLRPLAVAPFAGVGRQTLAERRHSGGLEVVLLDFAAGTHRRIAIIDDCPGVLLELERLGRYLVLACATPSAPSTVAHSLFWTELLDTEKRLRFRTPLLPEVAFADGTVVLSARRDLVAEVGKLPNGVFAVRP